MIPKDTVSLVRDRTDFVAVLSESVPSLKKRGRRFVGLCPFHKERTPSFHANPDTGLYHCFGCKESGDVFKFLERVEGYTFVQAVQVLAERVGIKIEFEEGGSAGDADRHRKEREGLYAIMQIAAVWYETQLHEHPQRDGAADELGRRDLAVDHEVVRSFRIGYAPPGWEGLATFLKRQGVSPAAAESVGLLVPRAGGTGYYDRFRHRLMFPVIDSQGRVVAFSGRVLAAVEGSEPPRDTPPPKYINSPESAIYTKGATLFGLWQARQAVRQDESAVLVEGNFDVVSLHAHGLPRAIAPLGTAFTVDQARLLRRYASTVILLFDGDAAGHRATSAAEGPCDQAGLDANVALLPHESDPDEFVRSKGPEALLHLIAHGKGLSEHLIDVELDEPFNAADSREQAARLARIQTLLDRQKDPILRGLLRAYADDRVASRLDLARRAPGTFATLIRQVGARARAEQVRVGPSPSQARISPRRPGHEQRKAIVGAILDFPVLLDESEIHEVLELLEGDSARIVAGVANCLQVASDGKKVLDSAEFLAQMPPAIQAFASARLAAPVHEGIEEARTTIMANAKRLLGTNVALETRATVREQEREAGDWEAAVERAKHVDGLVRERHGVVRR